MCKLQAELCLKSFPVTYFPEMAAELTASQRQVELLQTRLSTSEDQIEVHNTKLSTNGQQIEVLHTRLTTTEDQVRNSTQEGEGNQTRMML